MTWRSPAGRVIALEQENDRLKTEVEFWMSLADRMGRKIASQVADEIKAENYELTLHNGELCAVASAAERYVEAYEDDRMMDPGSVISAFEELRKALTALEEFEEKQ